MAVKLNDLAVLSMDALVVSQEYNSLRKEAQRVYKTYATVVSQTIMKEFTERAKAAGIDEDLYACWLGVPHLVDHNFRPLMNIDRIAGFFLTEDGWYETNCDVDDNMNAIVQNRRAEPQPDIPLDKINEILSEMTLESGVDLSILVYKLT